MEPVGDSLTVLRQLIAATASATTSNPFETYADQLCGTTDNTPCLYDALFLFPVLALYLWQLPFLLWKAQKVSAAYIPFATLHGRWPWLLVFVLSLVKCGLFLSPTTYQYIVGHESRVELGTALAAYTGAGMWLLNAYITLRRRARSDPLPDYLLWWYVVVFIAEVCVASHRAVEGAAYPDDGDLRVVDNVAIASACLAAIVALPAGAAIVMAMCTRRPKGAHAATAATATDVPPASPPAMFGGAGSSASGGGKKGFRGGPGSPSLSSPLLGRGGGAGSEFTTAAAGAAALSPYDTASLFSRMSFWWMNALMARGYLKPLETSDVPPLPWEDKAAQVGARFSAAWAKVAERKAAATAAAAADPSLRRVSRRGRRAFCCQFGSQQRLEEEDDEEDGGGLLREKGSLPSRGGLRAAAPWRTMTPAATPAAATSMPVTPSLNRVLASTFGPTFGAALLFKLSFDTLQFSGPILLSAIIGFLQDSAAGLDPPAWQGFAYSGLLLVSSLVQTVLLHAYFFRSFRAGQQMRSAIILKVGGWVGG